MSKQQTAADYLVEKLNQCEPFYSGVKSLEHKHYIDGLIEQAKEMEKEQIINTFKEAQVLVVLDDTKRAEQFYYETYERKVSDDHLPDVREMAASVQKLIDKDIFNQAILAMEEMYGSGCDAEIDAYFRGAKWMRQELNKQI